MWRGVGFVGALRRPGRRQRIASARCGLQKDAWPALLVRDFKISARSAAYPDRLPWRAQAGWPGRAVDLAVRRLPPAAGGISTCLWRRFGYGASYGGNRG